MPRKNAAHPVVTRPGTRRARSRWRGLLVLGLVATLAPAALGAPSSAATDPRPKLWERATAGHNFTSATVGVLGGRPIIAAADMSGTLRTIRPEGNGGWTRIVDPYPGRRSAVESTPAIADLDKDGRNEIVVGAGSHMPSTKNQHGGVVAYESDGTVKWRFRTADKFNPYTGGGPDGYSDGVFSSPAVGDVSGDGFPDVVFGSFDHRIYGLDGRSGRVLRGFPIDNRDTVFSSPALFDLDKDGVLEIIIGGDATRNPQVPDSFAGGVLRVLDLTDGKVTQRLERRYKDIVASSPAIADINRDGRVEAVFATGGFYHDPGSYRVHAVHLDNGSAVPGWPRSTSSELFGSPIIADFVPGGSQEVAIGDYGGRVYMWHGTGANVWARTMLNGQPIRGSMAAADVDGDGDQDLAMGWAHGGVLMVNGRNGQTIDRVGGTYAVLGAPAVVDDGTRRTLVAAGWNPAVKPSYASGAITAWRLPASSAPSAWPVFRRNAPHLGARPGPEARGLFGD